MNWVESAQKEISWPENCLGPPHWQENQIGKNFVELETSINQSSVLIKWYPNDNADKIETINGEKRTITKAR